MTGTENLNYLAVGQYEKFQHLLCLKVNNFNILESHVTLVKDGTLWL